MKEISEYFQNLNIRYKTGISTEHSYRGDLQNLLESLITGLQIINEPTHIKCGAPDYIITTKSSVPVAFIEAKDIGKPLDSKEFKKQFDRYKSSLDNLIITDYLEFRYFKYNEFVDSVSIGMAIDGRIIPKPENFDKFKSLINEFCLYRGQTINSAAKLSRIMASKAKMLAEIIENALENDEKDEDGSSLEEQMNAFKQILIHDIDPKGFADIYAQTIAYGMFAARLNDATLETFSRQEAAEIIPKSNPFLRKLFQYIAGYDLDERIRWIVDALAEIFRSTDVASILKNFGKITQQNDPMIHFYETFLSEYDPKLRKSRGVWYTPEPVVNFIVRAVDDILKTEFGLSQGLADTSKVNVKKVVEGTAVTKGKNKGKDVYKNKEVHKVQILDPATGTGTFLAEVVKHIYKNFEGQKGIWGNYVEEHLIPRLNGFELLMASYAMAHLKLDLLLKDTGCKFKKDQRFHIYLTNSLEEYHPDTGSLFASWLSHEAQEANYVKRDTPVMVVMGNPPYSGESANKGKWIMKLMEDYKKEPGGKEKLKERNPKWINDDYVKFLRYGQYYIEKNGEGILAFINPHGFLDNPTFRGMRWNLLKTYDKIYTIDLHGNSKKNEVCPDGSPDVNVFDIMQGVSINLFVKTGKKNHQELGKVFHYDLYGKREEKYNFLWSNKLETIPFAELPKVIPNYFFLQKDFKAETEYCKGFFIQNLFQVNSVGVVTSRDSFVIDDHKHNLEERIKEFFILDKEQIQQKYNLKEKKNWRIDEVKNKSKNFDLSLIHKLSYRPFDVKFIYYDDNFIERNRKAVMLHFLREGNVGLNWIRPMSSKYEFSIFISNNISDQCSAGNKSAGAGISYIAPLYLYPESNDLTLIAEPDRTPNLNMEIVQQIADKLGLTFTPEKEETEKTFAPIDILDYIYAVLHSPTYRDKYKEFLKIDFPRVPYPQDADKFWQLVKLGGELRTIHLLENPVVNNLITTYPENGNNEVTRKIGKKDFEITDKDNGLGKVWINDTQYFDKIPVIAWEFFIGGYQPTQKWLKDRSGRTLNFDDILHYQKIIIALVETDRLMKEIDGVFEN